MNSMLHLNILIPRPYFQPCLYLIQKLRSIESASFYRVIYPVLLTFLLVADSILAVLWPSRSVAKSNLPLNGKKGASTTLPATSPRKSLLPFNSFHSIHDKGQWDIEEEPFLHVLHAKKVLLRYLCIISIIRGEKKRPSGGMYGVVGRREGKTSKSMRMFLLAGIPLCVRSVGTRFTSLSPKRRRGEPWQIVLG